MSDDRLSCRTSRGGGLNEYQTVAADLAIVTILAFARIRANASRTLGRHAAEPDVEAVGKVPERSPLGSPLLGLVGVLVKL
jgi:hypothetical protein